ncbi:MAG: PfkB family carbohydrate kinase [Alphaproteobacteria bacterium]
MIVDFGSINVDLVVRVAALPRPGETVLAPGYDAVAGGKGANQAVAAARAGVRVHMVGSVGRDGFAAAALADMRAAGVDLTAVAERDSPTACAMICVDREGRNQIAVASGANRETRAAQLDDALLGRGTTVLLQLEIDPGETWTVIRRAKDRGARVVFNTAPAAPVPVAIAARCDVLVMNEIEAPALARAAGVAADDPIAAARRLADACDAVAIVTLGAEGARAFARDAAWRIGALPVTARDTTAAGDAFVGVLAAALDAGADLPAALHRASAAGGLACETPGAQPSLPEAAAIAAALSRLAPAERM